MKLYLYLFIRRQSVLELLLRTLSYHLGTLLDLLQDCQQHVRCLPGAAACWVCGGALLGPTGPSGLWLSPHCWSLWPWSRSCSITCFWRINCWSFLTHDADHSRSLCSQSSRSWGTESRDHPWPQPCNKELCNTTKKTLISPQQVLRQSNSIHRP